MIVLLLACAADLLPNDSEELAPADSGATETPQTPVQFTFPVLERELIETRFIIGVDHDPEEHGSGGQSIHCINFAGDAWPFCYDEHGGTDYSLIGGFDAMDAGSAWVIAAAPGEVIQVEDGHYDRCHLDLSTFEPTCDGHPRRSNKVVILHDSGHTSLYAHFMKHSIGVEEGDLVEAGDRLGLVGSSGYSSAPHLHFELQDADGREIDPYGGPYSQPESWWCDQRGDRELPGDCSATR